MVKPLSALLGLFLISASSLCRAQVVAGLDNWFNRETSAKTGQPFHYLWNDSDDSGFSRWGEIITQKGARITTLNKPNCKTLAGIDIYIIVDPDSIAETPHPNYIMEDDIKNIVRWVKKGGVLVLMANDGKHCGLTYLNHLSAKFGFTFNNVMLHPVVNNQYDMGAFTQFSDHPLFLNLKKIYMKETSSLKISEKVQPVLTENEQVFIAECTYGKGFVLAITDPWIYNEYIDHNRLPADFENRKAAENLTNYLLLKARH
jgi:unsaturated rhamnogalacturonyl hydrolase